MVGIDIIVATGVESTFDKIARRLVAHCCSTAASDRGGLVDNALL